MKLLLDQNLSPRLCDLLLDIWTDLVHVRAVGLAAADDSAVWAHARQYGFTIVSKDGDFSGRSAGHRDEIETFATEPDTTLLVIEPSQGAGAS